MWIPTTLAESSLAKDETKNEIPPKAKNRAKAATFNWINRSVWKELVSSIKIRIPTIPQTVVIAVIKNNPVIKTLACVNATFPLVVGVDNK